MDDERLDLLGLALARWKTFFICGVLGIGAAVLYLATAKEWYEATLSVVPSQRSQDVAAMSLAAKLPVGLDGLTTDVQRIRAVLASNSVADGVIEKFDLKKRYGSAHLQQARSALWGHCNIAVDRKSGVVSLTCEDTDPQVAKDMTTYFGEIGNKVFGRVSASSAREERKFLENQVTIARKDVDDASEKLRNFQETYKIIDLPEQSKATISAMASLQGELLSKQLELGYVSRFSSATEARVVQLQQQIGLIDGKLRQLEQPAVRSVDAGSGAGAGSGAFFPAAMNVPEIRFQLEQLVREQKVRETVFFLMTQRFEMAKIDEARDTSTFQILDYPTLPTFRSRPRRMKTAMTFGLASMAIASVLVLAPAWWRRRRTRSKPAA